MKVYQAWQDDTANDVLDFPEWLDQYHEHERETLTWIASWDARPVDSQLKADPRHATSFSVMDFTDRSVAIKRNFNHEDNPQWMVAS